MSAWRVTGTQMSQKIRILPDDVVNRIAAGEVVERPASVVKELVENAIDAQGTEISILVGGGGLREIRVIDNATGMGRDDALAAFERYATSKIRIGEDLSKIRTLGFRGEALPSIGSVSRVKMVTKEEKALSGTEIWLEGGQIREVRETGCPRGTDVAVRDLFFNTPARRKFLRSVATEFSHIMDVVVRIALAYGGIHFKLFHNEKRVLDVPSTKDKLIRIGSLLGNDVCRSLQRMRVRMDSLEIEGYLSNPTFTRPNPRGIYIYVNGRFIRDRIIHHALMEGYRSLIPKGRYPVAVLFLDLPAWSVDMNVHPTKSEVRFRSTDLVHRGVMALHSDFMRGPVHGLQEDTNRKGESQAPPRAVRESLASYIGPPSSRHPESASGSQASGGELFRRIPSSFRILGQFRRAYLVCESPGGLVLVDQHAAHERIVFQRLKRALNHGEPDAQRLLFPETMELSRFESERIRRYLPELKRLGFDLEPFGGNTVVIKSVPSVLSGKDSRQIVSDVIRDFAAESGRSGVENVVETALKVTACHGSIRSGQSLSMEEMVMLLEEMEKEGCFSTCPHGRPACVEIGLPQLEKMFMRSS
jgi:DNA mismatch repair protein MutL